ASTNHANANRRTAPPRKRPRFTPARRYDAAPAGGGADGHTAARRQHLCKVRYDDVNKSSYSDSLQESAMQRVTITIDDDLAAELDRFMNAHGYANRSEAIRD